MTAAAHILPAKIARLLALARAATERAVPPSAEELAQHLSVCESARVDPRQGQLFAPLGRKVRGRKRTGGPRAS